MKRKSFYIIDGSSYIFRAYHAIQQLSNAKGEPTNAIYGFCNMLFRLIDEKKPDYLAVAFDSKAPSFRKERFEAYKATREKPPEDISFQIAECIRVVGALNIASYQMEGFEADDLIATVKEAVKKEKGLDFVIVSGDKDLMQLVDGETVVYDSMREALYSGEEVKKKFGVEPRQLLDFFAIVGDSSDNIPGVKGIGPKGGEALIQQFGTLEKIYEGLDSISSKNIREKLRASREDAFLSRELVTLKLDVPISFSLADCALKEPNREAVTALFQRFEFYAFLKRFGRAETVESTSQAYHLISEEGQLERLVERLRKAEFVVFDVETTSLFPVEAELVGISVALEPKEAFYIPLAHKPADGETGEVKQLERERVLEKLKPVLENPDIKKCGHNLKYDVLVLRKYGIDVVPLAHDTMVMSYLLRPGSRGHGLDRLCQEHFNYQKIKYTDLVGSGKSEVTFDRVSLEKAYRYGCEDSDFTFRLYDVLWPVIKEKGLQELYDSIEMPLVEVLAEMEYHGVKIDADHLGRMGQEMDKKLALLEKNIYALAGEAFNINSPNQLSKILFEKLKLPVLKKTKTGMSTNEEVLQQLSSMHELPRQILDYRSMTKLKSTYIDSLPRLVNAETGRIHASYNQTVTATGRLSSSDPNLQNIPIRSEDGRRIREAFIPEKGFRLISADYSQVELRILAHLSGDPVLIQAFHDKRDIHAETARAIFGVTGADITDEMRRRAKAVNFGIIYGISDFGLANELGISRGEARGIIDQYFNQYQGVQRYLDGVVAEAKKTGLVKTLFDRLREIPELHSENPALRGLGERMAINTPIQGTAADLIKIAMIRLFKMLREKKWDAHLIMQVHDELVFEAKEELVGEIKEAVKKMMESVHEMSVPLTVEVSDGANWAEAH